MYRFSNRLFYSLEPPLVELLFSRNYRTFARKPLRVHIPVASEAEKTLKNYEDHVSKNNLSVEGKKRRKKPVVTDSKSSLHSNIGSKSEKDSALNERFTSNAEIPSDTGRIDLIHEIQYKHLDDANNRIRALLKNTRSRKFREEHKIFAVEGFRIIKEALDAGLTPEAIFFTQFSQLLQVKSRSSSLGLEELKALNDLPLYKIPYKTLQTWSSLTTCPGILGIFKHQESSTNYSMSHKSLPVTVILDQVREPGNVGGILRTLASVGVDHAILMKGCCDPWEPKVLRAASGGHFRLKLISKVTWNVLSNYIPENAPLLLADVCREVDLDRNVNVNMKLHNSSQVKSVNKENKSETYDEESVRMYEVDSEGNRIYVDPSYDDDEHLSNFESVHLPLQHYDEVEVFQKVSMSSTGAVIIIGGETGISSAAKKFAYVSGGIQVTIPLAKDMDSLNTSVAVGIILYEIRRQFCQLSLQS